MIHVIGQGAVGRALYRALQQRFTAAAVTSHSARSLEYPDGVAGLRLDLVPVEPGDTLIYAAGRAGEAACAEDPVQAAYDHHATPLVLISELRDAQFARLVLFGTTLPPTGLYGSLKHYLATQAHAREGFWGGRAGALLHLRCGQVIGPEMPVDGAGVVATWVRQAVSQQPLTIRPGHPDLDVTLLADLAAELVEWLTTPESLVSASVDAAVYSATLGLHELAYAVSLAALPEEYPAPPHVSPEIYAALRAMAAHARAAQVTA